MRLRPVGPLILHESNGETVLGDVRVPARTRIFVLTRPAALDPAHFDDPDSFRPERWLRPTGVHAPSAHIPFGSGPRLCPGRTLATLYKNFDVERIGDARGVREVFAFVMSPLGLKVRLRRRSVRPS
jgi:cytochrome P450